MCLWFGMWHSQIFVLFCSAQVFLLQSNNSFTLRARILRFKSMLIDATEPLVNERFSQIFNFFSLSLSLSNHHNIRPAHRLVCAHFHGKILPNGNFSIVIFVRNRCRPPHLIRYLVFNRGERTRCHRRIRSEAFVFFHAHVNSIANSEKRTEVAWISFAVKTW